MSDPFDALRDYASHLAESVPDTRSRAAVHRAIHGSRRVAHRRALVVVIASLGVFALANVAVAAAADSSAPGDPLYSVDRAYEWVATRVGLETDTTEERLDEATTMIARSEPDRALSLMSDAFDDAGFDAAAAELSAAGLNQAEFKATVGELVESAHMVSDADDRREAIEQVREMAQALAAQAGAENGGGESGDAGPASPPENPQDASPGQDDNPSDTRPGPDNNPGDTRPGTPNQNPPTTPSETEPSPATPAPDNPSDTRPDNPSDSRPGAAGGSDNAGGGNQGGKPGP